ncbi:MAG: hypothetical protein IID44_21730 [Planctomycetes bacterium]|nr:hypothetical protein [Planctomycetota bacterium]
MVRAFFLAMGISTAIVGLEFLAVDKATIISQVDAAGGGPPKAQVREIIPPDWVPWALLTAGIVVVIYSFTIPKRASA